MATKPLTQEQIDILSKSPYVLRATPTTLSFSKEFKEKFWELRKKGYSMTRCFILLGFDPEVLPQSRMISAYQAIQKEAVSPLGFTDINQPRANIYRSDGDYRGIPDNVALQKMQADMIHMQQEIDFLKKILAVDNQEDS